MAEQVGLESLPNEIFYHNLLPYLDRAAIFSLRQVNKRFHEVFSSNDCWKKFLHYPLKYYLCDLKSNSTAEGVSEILQEILQEDEKRHNWMNYCKLQEAHLRNWTNGRSMSYEIIDLPLSDMAYMEEVVDDNNEHLVCFSVGKTVHIWNVTAKPQCLGIFSIGPHLLVRFLPCRKLLVKGVEGSVLALYELLPQVNTLQLKIRFKFNDEGPIGNENQGGDANNPQFSLYFRFILMSHIFVGFICQFPVTEDCILHFWSLNENRRLYGMSLADNFLIFERFICENGVMLRHIRLVSVFEGESPFVIVVLKHITSNVRLSQISTFDTTARCFTHVAHTCSEVVACSMSYSKVLVQEKIPYRVSVFSLPKVETGNDGLILSQCLYLFEYNNPNYNVELKSSKILIRTESEVQIVMTDSTINVCTIPMDVGYKILGFIEPKILLMYDSKKNPTSTEVKVYNIFSQRLIRSWDCVNTNSCRFNHYLSNLVYPSKLILNIGNLDQFRVYNF